MLTFASLKSEVVEHHKGKIELEAMDDVLPIWIYCVASAELQGKAWQIHAKMDAYLEVLDGYELERKVLCHFDCAVRYVTDEW